MDFSSIKNLALAVLLGTCALAMAAPAEATEAESEVETITLMGTLRDFSDAHPDFERNPGETSDDGTRFRYGIDRNITSDVLGEDNKPVYLDGSFSTTTKESFDQWYRDVEGVNQSMRYPITLIEQDNGIYRYENRSFFPLNNKLFGNEGRSKNFHFTYELNTTFTYQGGEVFNFSGDDDVWVYINGSKVIELGGVHSRADANVSLEEVAEEIGLVIGETYALDFFFAERHTSQSNLIIETSIEFEQEMFAD